jgi:hypothetical protein
MAADVLEEGALVNDQRAGAGESLVLQSAEGNTGADGQPLRMAAHQRRQARTSKHCEQRRDKSCLKQGQVAIQECHLSVRTGGCWSWPSGL